MTLSDLSHCRATEVTLPFKHVLFLQFSIQDSIFFLWTCLQSFLFGFVVIVVGVVVVGVVVGVVVAHG